MNTCRTPLLIASLCLSLGGFGTAQPGFSKWFDFGIAANFHNVVLNEDTLILAGTAKNALNTQWGALFVKMDTAGSILDFRLHLDAQGGQFAFDQGYPLISTPDEGYLMAGNVFDRGTYFIYKLDINGNIQFFREYTLAPDVRTVRPEQLIALPDGYLVFSTRQMENYPNDIYVTKISLTGEVEWEQGWRSIPKIS